MLLFNNTNNEVIKKISNPSIVFVYSITIWSFAEKIKTFIAGRCLPVAFRIHINAGWFQSGLIGSPVSIPHPPLVSPSILVIGLQGEKTPLTWSLASCRKHQKNPGRSKSEFRTVIRPTIFNISEQKGHYKSFLPT